MPWCCNQGGGGEALQGGGGEGREGVVASIQQGGPGQSRKQAGQGQFHLRGSRPLTYEEWGEEGEVNQGWEGTRPAM